MAILSMISLLPQLITATTTTGCSDTLKINVPLPNYNILSGNFTLRGEYRGKPYWVQENGYIAIWYGRLNRCWIIGSEAHRRNGMDFGWLRRQKKNISDSCGACPDSLNINNVWEVRDISKRSGPWINIPKNLEKNGQIQIVSSIGSEAQAVSPQAEVSSITEETTVVPSTTGSPRPSTEETTVVPSTTGSPRPSTEETTVVPSTTGSPRPSTEETTVVPSTTGSPRPSTEETTVVPSTTGSPTPSTEETTVVPCDDTTVEPSTTKEDTTVEPSTTKEDTTVEPITTEETVFASSKKQSIVSWIPLFISVGLILFFLIICMYNSRKRNTTSADTLRVDSLRVQQVEMEEKC